MGYDGFGRKNNVSIKSISEKKFLSESRASKKPSKSTARKVAEIQNRMEACHDPEWENMGGLTIIGAHYPKEIQEESENTVDSQSTCLNTPTSIEVKETPAKKLRQRELQATLEQAVTARPDSAQAWYEYGDYLLSVNRDAEAVAPLGKAVELSPGTALFHYDLGLAFFRLGRHEEARREFSGIVAKDPQLQRASSHLVLSSLTNLALSQDMLGRADEAAKTLEPALQTAIDILFNLGRLRLRAKRAAAAIDLLQAAALLAPDSEAITHGVGRALLDLKRESEAIPFLVRATELDPSCTDAWYDLGVMFLRLKQQDKARSCFRKVLRLDAKYALAYYNLACLNALDGKSNTAFDNLEKAVAQGFRDVELLRRDADLRGLRRDARWKTLVTKINEQLKVVGVLDRWAEVNRELTALEGKNDYVSEERRRDLLDEF